MITSLTLVAMVSGQRKNGQGAWYRATLKGRDDAGNPVVRDFFLSPEVGEKAVKDGMLEDCAVKVQLGFDNYMRPNIIGLEKVASPVSKTGA